MGTAGQACSRAGRVGCKNIAQMTAQQANAPKGIAQAASHAKKKEVPFGIPPITSHD
jgi:hypothetical protein